MIRGSEDVAPDKKKKEDVKRLTYFSGLLNGVVFIFGILIWTFFYASLQCLKDLFETQS